MFSFSSEAKHCPPSSDTRSLITKPRSECQREVILNFFDEKDSSDAHIKCFCCYNCIHLHADKGCYLCKELLDTFLPASLKQSKSLSSEIKSALEELFAAMSVKLIQVENNLVLSISSFSKDVVKNVDEINSAKDISRMWHVSSDVALKVFSILTEVIYGDEISDSGSSSDESDDDFDEEYSDSSDDNDGTQQLELLDIFDDE